MVETPALMPHAVCWAAAPRLIWTMVVANLVTFVSYVSIGLTLLYVARRTLKIMDREWIFFVVGFALFIAACGTTHMMDVVTTWIPVFWLDATTVIVTAILSAYVAVQLIRRAEGISFAINDYADRLGRTEVEKDVMRDKLIAARKLEDWSRMSAAVSHEISNPLETIQNILYLASSDPSVSADLAQQLRAAQAEVGRVADISRSALSFHREPAQPEKVDLPGVCASVHFLLKSMVYERKLTLDVVADGELAIEGFPVETRQVVLNLARNACEASKAGSRVELALRSRDGGVELQVTDEGPGVAPEMLPRLFEFGKSSKGTASNGLGLWTVRQLVLKHGGRIDLDRSYRKGARFVVWWPAKYNGNHTPQQEPQLAVA